MRRFLLITTAFCFLSISIVATQAQDQTGEKNESKYWTVKGYRHGPSFFPRNFLEETKPLQEGVMDFKHYHTYHEMIWWFKKWADEYPVW